MQAALFHPPDDPENAAQVERPNVAAIVAEEAVRMASTPSREGHQPMDGIEGRMSGEGRISPVASRLSELGRTGHVGNGQSMREVRD